MIETNKAALADLLFRRLGAGWRDVALIVLGSIATALAAQVWVPLPWTPVPVTGQTFAVLLCGAALGWRRGMLAQLLYLAEGLSGLPVFAQGNAGLPALLGPTGGYLISFPLAAAATGALAQLGWDRRFWTMLVCMLAGSVVIFALGLAQLARFLSGPEVLRQGLLPFIAGDIIKAILASIAFPAAWRIAGGERADDAAVLWQRV